MLVLSRKIGESIMIGDDIEVTIIDWQPNRVRVGVVAPRSIPVFRKEIWEQRQVENLEAPAALPEGGGPCQP